MTEIIFIFISLIHTVLCMDIPAPVNLNISSEYLVHLLSWSMGPGSPAGVHYTVSMRTLSNKNVMLVKGCEKVTSPLQCNLTEAFSDPIETYYTNVSAVLGNHTSPPAHCSPFRPIVNSVLESPLVSVTVCNTSLCVSLRSPSPELHDIYNSFRFHYRLTITSEDGPEFHRDVEGLQKVTVNELTPGRRYCVTVSIIDRRYTSRPAVCVSTPKKTDNISVTDVLIALGVCLLMVLLVVWVIPRLLSHFLTPKVDLPKVLKFQDHHKVYRVLLIPAESISTLTEDTDALQKMKKNTDEHEETDGDTEEDGVMYERLATQHLQAQDTSSSSVIASDSSNGCGPLENQSSADVCSVYEGDGFSDSPHLLTETRPLLKSVHEQDGAAVLEDEDVNLCSVMLRRDTSFSDTHEFELITDSFDTPVNIHMSDCEQDSEEEYSEYLSRS